LAIGQVNLTCEPDLVGIERLVDLVAMTRAAGEDALALLRGRGRGRGPRLDDERPIHVGADDARNAVVLDERAGRERRGRRLGRHGDGSQPGAG
jgi:hypothetical protein